MFVGFAFKLLSMISLGSDALYRHDPVPFSQELENQYGAGILCLPYTISPLSLLELIHSSSYNQATASESLRFLPTSVKPNLVSTPINYQGACYWHLLISPQLAAYPVLIPLYLAQYEVSLLDDVIQSMTVVIEAYSDKVYFPHPRISKIQRNRFPAFRDVSSPKRQVLKLADAFAKSHRTYHMCSKGSLI